MKDALELIKIDSVGEVPADGLSDEAKRTLTDYLMVQHLADHTHQEIPKWSFDDMSKEVATLAKHIVTSPAIPPNHILITSGARPANMEFIKVGQ